MSDKLHRTHSNAVLCRMASESLRKGVGSLSNLPKLINDIIDERAWEEREVVPGRVVKMNSLLELVTSDPIDGWGEDPKRIELLLKADVAVLEKWNDAITGKHGGDRRSERAIKDNNIMLDSVQGTSKSYTVARLSREAPELLERVKNNELSANAAAILAGFRKKTFQVVADDPHAAARSLLKHFEPDVLVAAIRDVANG